MSQNTISCGGGGGSGGESQPRYLSSSSSHMGGDRRRRGKTMNGGYYNNSGPRGDTRISTTYRGGDGGSRYSHRQGGGSGDGPHNSGSSGGGGGYRGGSDYDYQPSGGGGSEGGHVRTSHSSHYQHHQYPQQSHHHNQSHHHQGKGLDYEPSSRGGQPRSQHQSDHHRSTVSQQTDNCSGQSHSGYSGAGGNVHHYQSPPSSSEVIVVASSQQQQQQQEHPFPSGTGGHAHVTGPFPVPGHPPPAVGIIGIHPNSQPMFGTLALCHIPYGINPSSVISPAVYTQIIGSGFVAPGLPYNYPCGFPSPMVPSHPVILQQASHPQQVQQHFHPNAYQQHHCAGAPVGGMQAQHQSTGEDCMGFDSSAVLNPDADAFFPPAFPPGNDAETEEGQRGSPSSAHNICNEPGSGLETSEIKSDEDSDAPRNEDAKGEVEGIQTVTKGDSED